MFGRAGKQLTGDYDFDDPKSSQVTQSHIVTLMTLPSVNGLLIPYNQLELKKPFPLFKPRIINAWCLFSTLARVHC